MSEEHDERGGEEPRVVVRDRRRIDPDTGQVRQPAADADAASADPGEGAIEGTIEFPDDDAPGATPVDTAQDTSGGAGADAPQETDDLDPAAELKTQLDERTADLQRLQAEYANYRKRVDRDREAVISSAKAGILIELLGVLDDIERADAHGDLTGAFKAVADKLAATLQRAGLEAFGHDGEPFDPAVHEAVQHSTSPDVDGPTVTGVLRRGYRFGDRVVRAAMVAVTDAGDPEES